MATAMSNGIHKKKYLHSINDTGVDTELFNSEKLEEAVAEEEEETKQTTPIFISKETLEIQVNEYQIEQLKKYATANTIETINTYDDGLIRISDKLKHLEYYDCYEPKNANAYTKKLIQFGNQYEIQLEEYEYDIECLSFTNMLLMGRFLNSLADKLNKIAMAKQPQFKFHFYDKIYSGAILYKHRLHMIQLLHKTLLLLSNFKCPEKEHASLKDNGRIGCLSLHKHIATVLQVLAVVNKAIIIVDETEIKKYKEDAEMETQNKFPVYFYVKLIKCMKYLVEARLYELTFLTHLYDESSLLPLTNNPVTKEYYWLSFTKCVILYEYFASYFIIVYSQTTKQSNKNMKLKDNLLNLLHKYLFHFYIVRAKFLFDICPYYYSNHISYMSLVLLFYKKLQQDLEKWKYKYIIANRKQDLFENKQLEDESQKPDEFSDDDENIEDINVNAYSGRSTDNNNNNNNNPNEMYIPPLSNIFADYYMDDTKIQTKNINDIWPCPDLVNVELILKHCNIRIKSIERVNSVTNKNLIKMSSKVTNVSSHNFLAILEAKQKDHLIIFHNNNNNYLYEEWKNLLNKITLYDSMLAEIEIVL
jgi:hypothetical protein